MLQHDHCDNCIRLIRCMASEQSQQFCSIIFCELQCGARFHACKQEEHRLLCEQEIVSCLNRSFGCKKQMRRREIRAHLSHCPASVVHCSIEWNRWPFHSRNSRLAQPLLDAAALSSQNLDVGLTLRDQRLLPELNQTDPRVRCLLCNPLTRKYPTLPISPYFGIRNGEPHRPAGNNSPIQTTTTGGHCNGSSNTIARKTSRVDPPEVHQLPAGSGIASKKQTSICHSSDDDSESSPWQMHKSPPGLRSSVCAKLNQSHVITCDFGKQFYESTGSDKFDEPSGEELLKVTFDQSATDTHASDIEIDLQNVSTQNDFNREKGSVDTNQSDNTDNQSTADFYKQVALVENLVCCSPTNVGCSLILDLNFDSIAFFQPKPTQMFTFRCAQEFRRDEYQAHYHNIHSDIMGSLSGWMERRCPLWQYGCPAVFTRIHPFPVGSKIVYSPLLESFGHLMVRLDNVAESKSGFPLMNLPTELIERVVEQLDNFTVNIVALTCKKLRNIVSRLLNSRGLVSLVWKRVEQDGGDDSDQGKDFTDKSVQCHRWIVGRYRWFFSNSIHEINRWRLMDEGQMLNHLQKCPFNRPLQRSDPIFLRGIGSNFYEEVNAEEPRFKNGFIKR